MLHLKKSSALSPACRGGTCLPCKGPALLNACKATTNSLQHHSHHHVSICLSYTKASRQEPAKDLLIPPFE